MNEASSTEKSRTFCQVAQSNYALSPVTTQLSEAKKKKCMHCKQNSFWHTFKVGNCPDRASVVYSFYMYDGREKTIKECR